MNYKDKYEQIASFFDKSNAGKASKEELENIPENQKLVFFWEHCMPDKIDASLIISTAEQKINRRQTGKERRLTIFKITSAAASLALIISLSFYFLAKNDNVAADLKEIAVKNTEIMHPDKIVLLTSNEQLMVDEDVLIQYAQTGEISFISDALQNSKAFAAKETPKTPKTVKDEYHQLIVPKGKRSKMQLPDGTLIWVNAQSKVIYPRTFNNDTRNIYVRGEVYLEVRHDATRPFIVTANDFDLKVLGTKFNITNYGIESTNIVLVEGAVEVTDKKDKIVQLCPNHLLAIEDGMIVRKKEVDTDEYTSWINGIFVLKGDKLSNIARKLEARLGINVHCAPDVENERAYGKLDLKNNLSEILESMRQTFPITVQQINGEIYLRKR
ncbi:MAG: FecR domain-containing protein [Dysgonamonadaceae bacterium]|jgi:hypothetical protein|nr:FecR domain-containing protein [Dysgonamonadaceae bacterium]